MTTDEIFSKEGFGIYRDRVLAPSPTVFVAHPDVLDAYLVETGTDLRDHGFIESMRLEERE